MKYVLILMFLFTELLLSQKGKPDTVPYVDLQQYLGLWYEIGKIPNSFQDHCIGNTTAEYSLNEDGTLKVINKCHTEDGDQDIAEGVARIVDSKSKAKLEVSFVSLFGINFFWGDYWIIGLDENYQWAVVGHPERKYGWILSRSPQVSPVLLDSIFEILKERGYNKKDFVLTNQK